MKFKIVILLFIILSISAIISNYVIIDNKIYKTDVKQLHIYSLSNSEIKEINKCDNIKILSISDIRENQVSKFNSLSNLEILILNDAILCSEDTKNLSTFTKLNQLYISLNSTIDFSGLSNKNVKLITLYQSNAENLKSLIECESLVSLEIYKSTVSDNYIVKENGKYILKDSSVFSSLDNLVFLAVTIDKIEDISGILEMDSLKTFCVAKDSISETDEKLLGDKGISIVYYGENE